MKKGILNYVEKITNTIINNADHQDGIMKWVHAEHRRRPSEVAAQTGLMQGSAGIGLWFLRLHAFSQNKKPLIYFPDEIRI